MSDQTGVDATRRTRLANERTFLAWWRTSLGCLGLAVGVGRVLPEVSDGPHWPYVVLGMLLAVLGSALALIGWWRHVTVDRALRGGEEATTPAWLVATLSATLSVAGVAVLVIVITA
jgi:putative membrane protein